MTNPGFWLAAMAMVALGWAVLCLPMWRRGELGRARPSDRDSAAAASGRSADRATIDPRAAAPIDTSVRDGRKANLAILAEQLQALDADLAAGRVDAFTHQSAALEIQRRLLAEAEGDGENDFGTSTGTGTGTGTGTNTNTDADANIEVKAKPGRADAGPQTRRSRVPALPWALAVCLPAIAVGGYALLGNQAALTPPVAAATTPGGEVSEKDVAAMVDTLSARLQSRPAAGIEDLQGWVMLGRSNAALQRFDAAAQAYARALALSPDDPQLLADRADMLAMQQGQRLDGEPERLIARALAIDPKQLKALAMAGSAAFERQQWAEASGYWRRARALLADGSELAQGLDRSLAEAAAAADRASPGTGVAPPVAGPGQAIAGLVAAVPQTAAADGGGRAGTSPLAVQGRVDLSPALVGRIAPGDTVFVFARAAQGPRMPLAILRRTAADLPLDFRLDDSQAMSPALRLSGFPEVVVGVRVSRSGQAMPQAGDLIGEAPARPGGAAVRITIDRVQP